MMDTPAVKSTYEAAVIAPKELKVKMSANETGVATYNSTHSVTRFLCEIKMPSYLIALAVGDLEYRAIGPRSGVITEPSQMDAVAAELENLEQMLDAAE